MHLAVSIVLYALLGNAVSISPSATSPTQGDLGEVANVNAKPAPSNRTRTFRIRLKTASDLLPWQSADRRAYNLSVFMAVDGPERQYWNLEYAPNIGCGSGLAALDLIPWKSLDEPLNGYLEVTTQLTGPLYIDVSGSNKLPGNEQDRFTEIQRQANGDVDLTVTFLDERNGPGWGIRWADPRPEPIPIETQMLGDPWTIHLDQTDDGKTIYVGAAGELASVPSHVWTPPKQWAVTKSGMLPHYGTNEEFVATKNGLAMATVAHFPGWGTQLQVIDEQGLAVPGAKIIVNEQPIGESDSDGNFTLRLPAQPTSIRIELGGLAWIGYPTFIAKHPWTTAVLE